MELNSSRRRVAPGPAVSSFRICASAARRAAQSLHARAAFTCSLSVATCSNNATREAAVEASRSSAICSRVRKSASGESCLMLVRSRAGGLGWDLIGDLACSPGNCAADLVSGILHVSPKASSGPCVGTASRMPSSGADVLGSCLAVDPCNDRIPGAGSIIDKPRRAPLPSVLLLV